MVMDSTPIIFFFPSWEKTNVLKSCFFLFFATINYHKLSIKFMRKFIVFPFKIYLKVASKLNFNHHKKTRIQTMLIICIEQMENLLLMKSEKILPNYKIDYEYPCLNLQPRWRKCFNKNTSLYGSNYVRWKSIKQNFTYSIFY